MDIYKSNQLVKGLESLDNYSYLINYNYISNLITSYLSWIAYYIKPELILLSLMNSTPKRVRKARLMIRIDNDIGYIFWFNLFSLKANCRPTRKNNLYYRPVSHSTQEIKTASCYDLSSVWGHPWRVKKKFKILY